MAVLHPDDVAPLDPHPYDIVEGRGSTRTLSDAGGLTRFGVRQQTLEPGARTSHRHWHEAEDEFLYVLAGEATVVENDGPHRLGPGDFCCWCSARGQRCGSTEALRRPGWRSRRRYCGKSPR